MKARRLIRTTVEQTVSELRKKYAIPLDGSLLYSARAPHRIAGYEGQSNKKLYYYTTSKTLEEKYDPEWKRKIRKEN